jgi:hypothetical protein
MYCAGRVGHCRQRKDTLDAHIASSSKEEETGELCKEGNQGAGEGISIVVVVVVHGKEEGCTGAIMAHSCKPF